MSSIVVTVLSLVCVAAWLTFAAVLLVIAAMTVMEIGRRSVGTVQRLIRGERD